MRRGAGAKRRGNHRSNLTSGKTLAIALAGLLGAAVLLGYASPAHSSVARSSATVLVGVAAGSNNNSNNGNCNNCNGNNNSNPFGNLGNTIGGFILVGFILVILLYVLLALIAVGVLWISVILRRRLPPPAAPVPAAASPPK
jgi:ABC-type Na+ efflux pump permease subunit